MGSVKKKRRLKMAKHKRGSPQEEVVRDTPCGRPV